MSRPLTVLQTKVRTSDVESGRVSRIDRAVHQGLLVLTQAYPCPAPASPRCSSGPDLSLTGTHPLPPSGLATALAILSSSLGLDI